MGPSAMSASAPIESQASSSPPPALDGQVRAARSEDTPAVAIAVRELLFELGGTPPSAAAIEATARALVDDRRAGALLVAEGQRTIVGVLGASWQIAMHVSGRYALIQDLWVHPAWRSRSIGAALIAALCELAREQQFTRIEVGLPRQSFARIRATEAFYLNNGFEPLGERLRRVLP